MFLKLPFGVSFSVLYIYIYIYIQGVLKGWTHRRVSIKSGQVLYLKNNNTYLHSPGRPHDP